MNSIGRFLSIRRASGHASNVPVVKEQYMVDWVFFPHTEMKIDLTHAHIFRTQLDAGAVAALTGGYITWADVASVAPAIGGEQHLVHKAVQFTATDSVHEVARRRKSSFLAVLDGGQNGVGDGEEVSW